MRQITFYCNNCSEKIEVTEKSIFDGGRYCGVCRNDYLVRAYGSKIFMSVAFAIGLFGIGSLWRGGEKPLNLSVKQIAVNPTNQNKTVSNQTVSGNSNTTIKSPPQTNVSQINSQTQPRAEVKQNVSAPASNDETTYYCGALTKKGTPCSRRVKGGGRCWQHQGQKALLPPEKLLADQ